MERQRILDHRYLVSIDGIVNSCSAPGHFFYRPTCHHGRDRRTDRRVTNSHFTGAALIAARLQPKCLGYMIASHRSVERGHQVLLDHLGLKPLLDLDLRLGEGTGACLAMNLVCAAVKIMTEMATFDEAGVSERNT